MAQSHPVLRHIFWKLLVTASLICSWLPTSVSHPQCLDFAPPFEPKESLSFCSKYEEFGCCTKENDTNINAMYSKIIQQSFNDGPTDQCKDYLRDVLCEKCSPYAAHVFDAEGDLQANSFPGLCGFYCKAFYSQCRHLVQYITDDVDILLSLSTQDQFCSQIAITDNDYCFPDVNVNTDFNREISRETRNDDGCMCLEPFADSLRNPLAFRSPPDDTDRIFIAEQLGVVHVYYQNKTKVEKPFLDLTHMVISSSYPGDERGFFNLAFHPDFVNNRKLYVYFSINHEGRLRTRISEFTVSSNNRNSVDENSERIILEIPQPYFNHNGGELLFGVDGLLYITVGDGGAANDPMDAAQNKSSLLGSVLRIDIDRRESGKPYGIPADNPFVGEPNSLPEIYALGVRNAWRCDIDEGDPLTGSGRGRLFCGDVGQGDWEEIDLVQRGDNLGWAAKEGPVCFKQNLCQDSNIGDLVDPIYAYDHSVGKSVTGGHVYRGCQYPNLRGKYIYGDYVDGKIFVLTEGASGQWTNKRVRMCESDICLTNLGLVNRYPRNILSFGEDANGEMYVLTTENPSSTAAAGKVFKLIDPKRREDPTECLRYRIRETTTAVPTTVPTTSEVAMDMGVNSGLQHFLSFLLIPVCILLQSVLGYQRITLPVAS